MALDSQLTHSKMRIRIAVLSFFLAQGLCFASWASRLPDIKNHFSADNFIYFGLLMFLIPVGKFIAIPLVGFLLPRIGSKKTVLISILGFTLSLFIVGVITNIYILGVVLLLFGTFWNMTDISLNTQAIEVERIYGKNIIATFHAGWSLAACVGAVIGYAMINLKIDTLAHFSAIAVIASVMILVNYKCLQEHKGENKAKEVEPQGLKTLKKAKLPEAILISLGFVWLLALIVENTMFEWSDVYFQSVIKAPESLQIGFLVFMIMMFSGRLLTNAAYRIWKKKTVLQIAGGLIFVGFVISSLFINLSDTVLIKVIINSSGFMLIGLGISCIVPTIYSIVGEKAKTPVGLALTIMSSISFVGPLVAPLLVGYISQHIGMEVAYLVIGLFGACIVGIATFNKALK
ncbi:MFS transporter [Dysgonomonas sp. ZJ709]|uniref:MFS transporter n=1 Tax=Dysgonomonas sp. ZJ709 TaxID=2709797 RepID=UPI0013ED41C6|nr:MFS transporter [Dysgonomonas sp. ZJ709]